MSELRTEWAVRGLAYSEPLWTAVNETETVNAEPVAGVAGTVVVADFITFLDRRSSSQRWLPGGLRKRGGQGLSAHEHERGERARRGWIGSNAHLATDSACNATLFGAFALLLDLCGGYLSGGERARSLRSSLGWGDGGLWLALCLGDHGRV